MRLQKKRVLIGTTKKGLMGRSSFLLGVTLAVIGRMEGHHWLPAIVPAVDTLSAMTPQGYRRAFYAGYGLGIVAVYSDKFYHLVASMW